MLQPSLLVQPSGKRTRLETVGRQVLELPAVARFKGKCPSTRINHVSNEHSLPEIQLEAILLRSAPLGGKKPYRCTPVPLIMKYNKGGN